MRWLAVMSLLAACSSVEQPDEIEIRISTGAIERANLSRIIALVDPPVPFDREAGYQSLAPGIDFEFFDAGDSNRLMVIFLPPPTATTIDQDLLFTVDVGGQSDDRGTVRVIAYDRLEQAVAHAEKLDVAFGGFQEVSLTLACDEPECAPSPGLGGYPVTLDASRAVSTAPIVMPTPYALVSSDTGLIESTVFIDPDFDGGRGRIAIVDPVRASMFTSFELPPNMLPCVITGDAPGDRFGASVAYGKALPGAGGEFVAVGAPGEGGAGRVYVLPLDASLSCPRTNAGAQPGVVQLTGTSTTSFGERLAYTATSTGGDARLLIGAAASGDAAIFAVGSVSGSTALDATNASILRVPGAGAAPLTLAGTTAFDTPVFAFATQGRIVAVTHSLAATGENVATPNAFGTEITAGQLTADAMLWLRGKDGERLLAWGGQNLVIVLNVPDGPTVDADCLTNSTCILGAHQEGFGSALSVVSVHSPNGDLIVGAPTAVRLDTNETAGAIYVLNGERLGHKANSPVAIPNFGRDADDPTQEILYRIYGGSADERFGQRLDARNDTTITAVGGNGNALYLFDELDTRWGPR